MKNKPFKNNSDVQNKRVREIEKQAKYPKTLFFNKFAKVQDETKEKQKEEAFEEIRKQLKRYHKGITKEQIKYVIDE